MPHSTPAIKGAVFEDATTVDSALCPTWWGEFSKARLSLSITESKSDGSIDTEPSWENTDDQTKPETKSKRHQGSTDTMVIN